MEKEFMVEECMDKYQLCKKIGSGGSGIVWKAYDRYVERYVAIKEFEKESAEADWEVEMLKELNHSAFPIIFDYVKSENANYLVMEYIEGQNLLHYIEENGKVEQEQAVQWTMELAEVLQFLHERKQPVLYRDMKPANVLIDTKGNIRLIDFGTVCYRYEQKAQVCKVAGTKGYAAPEQMEETGVRSVDERCDIYGLGATLFHMLTGCNPSMPPFLLQPLRTYDRRLSAGLEKIVAKATAGEKERRYANIRRMKRDLEKYKVKDKVRKTISKAFVTGYYVCLAGGACHFLSCWGKAERYLIGTEVSHMGEKQMIETQMLSAACFLLILCIGKCIAELWNKRGIRGIRQERNIILTEKKSNGIFLIFAGLLIAGCLLAKQEVSAQGENTLFVNVRNSKGQKLLIRYDAEYPLADTLRLELPLDNFEKGERYELRLECRNRDTGESQSRIFYLKGLEP